MAWPQIPPNSGIANIEVPNTSLKAQWPISLNVRRWEPPESIGRMPATRSRAPINLYKIFAAGAHCGAEEETRKGNTPSTSTANIDNTRISKTARNNGGAQCVRSGIAPPCPSIPATLTVPYSSSPALCVGCFVGTNIRAILHRNHLRGYRHGLGGPSEAVPPIEPTRPPVRVTVASTFLGVRMRASCQRLCQITTKTPNQATQAPTAQRQSPSGNHAFAKRLVISHAAVVRILMNVLCICPSCRLPASRQVVFIIPFIIPYLNGRANRLFLSPFSGSLSWL